jgi:hypothetical protein
MSQCGRGCIDEKLRHCDLAARAVDQTPPLLRYSTFALRDPLGNISHSCRDALHSARMCYLPTPGIALCQPSLRQLLTVHRPRLRQTAIDARIVAVAGWLVIVGRSYSAAGLLNLPQALRVCA